jgi:hypothetical protein
MSKNDRVQIKEAPVVNEEIQMPETGTAAPLAASPRKSSAPKGVTKAINASPLQKRKYKNESTIDSDLFRLKLAEANKNVSWDEKVISLEKVAHTHFFHTFDSDGKKLKYSAAVGGHFHEIYYEENVDGVAIITGVSGPLNMVKRRLDDGRYVTQAEPLSSKLQDKHTHEIEYVMSQTVLKRTPNAEAIEVAASDANKTAPIQGVIG